MIIFKDLKLKNFRSFGNQWEHVQLDRNPLTLISAPNGSGKSTILMAIEWCLFGRISNLTKKEILNNVNRAECCVELTLYNDVKKIEIRVARGIEPNYFEIYRDGELVPQNATIMDYQEVVYQLTGLNKNIFGRIVSINGSSYVPFLSLNQPSRRAMVEDILEITELRAINIRNNEVLNSLENDINVYKGKIEALEHTINRIQEDKREDGNANRERIKSLLVEMEETLGGKPLGNLEAEFQKMQFSKHSLAEKQARLRKDCEFWNGDKCPTCGQDIATGLKEEKLKENEEQLKKIAYTLLIANDVVEKTSDVIMRAKRLEMEISNLLAVKEKTENTDTIEDLQKTCDGILTNLQSLQDTARYHQAIKKWLKDDGIRSIIIAKYLPLFNKILKKYLTDIGLDVSIELDKMFEARITRRNGEERSYASFSAGERARIDLCFLLSWKTLISTNKFVDTSLLFLDEIYDSVLDGEGLDNLIRLLYNMKNTNVFFISHREGISELFQHRLEIVKDRGFSHIL